MVWPLVHWLKARRHAGGVLDEGDELRQADQRASRLMYRYMQALVDGLILYSEHELRHARAGAPGARRLPQTIPSISKAIRPSRTLARRSSASSASRSRRWSCSSGASSVGGQRKKVRHLIEIFRDRSRRQASVWSIVGSGMTPELLRSLNPANTRYLGELHDPAKCKSARYSRWPTSFRSRVTSASGSTRRSTGGCPS